MSKLEWSGVITSVQPRIRLNRSFDERNHGYLGFSLRVDGVVSGIRKIFWVGIGKAAQERFKFECGISAKGKANPVQNPQIETVEYYKVSALKVTGRIEVPALNSPTWLGVPPDLETFRLRGHRRLSARTYEAKCSNCKWGCRMPVIITIDHWNPSMRQYRNETFCYGPKSCGFYKAGPTRKVPGRTGMLWEEEDWVDDEAIAHREPNE